MDSRNTHKPEQNGNDAQEFSHRSPSLPAPFFSGAEGEVQSDRLTIR